MNRISTQTNTTKSYCSTCKKSVNFVKFYYSCSCGNSNLSITKCPKCGGGTVNITPIARHTCYHKKVANETKCPITTEHSRHKYCNHPEDDPDHKWHYIREI